MTVSDGVWLSDGVALLLWLCVDDWEGVALVLPVRLCEAVNDTLPVSVIVRLGVCEGLWVMLLL